MRKPVILTMFIFVWFVGRCQTDGYKNIKVGQKFEPKNLSQLYTIEQIAESGFRLTSLTEQTFCDMAIAFIDIKLNSDSSINLIQLNTVDKTYKDYSEFDGAYNKVAECIINTVGKPVYYDPGTNRKDGQMTMAWNFDNKKYWLSLFGNTLSIYEHQVPRHFMIAWAQGKETTKMW